MSIGLERASARGGCQAATNSDTGGRRLDCCERVGWSQPLKSPTPQVRSPLRTRGSLRFGGPSCFSARRSPSTAPPSPPPTRSRWVWLLLGRVFGSMRLGMAPDPNLRASADVLPPSGGVWAHLPYGTWASGQLRRRKPTLDAGILWAVPRHDGALLLARALLRPPHRRIGEARLPGPAGPVHSRIMVANATSHGILGMAMPPTGLLLC